MSRTVTADARETPGKTRDLPRAFLFCLGDKRFDIQILKINDPVAAGADEMAMIICPCVKMVGTLKARKLADLTKLGQQIQVAVHGSQTDIRISHPHIFVNDIRGRVVGAPLQKAEDRFSLTAVFVRCHGIPPLRQKRLVRQLFRISSMSP